MQRDIWENKNIIMFGQPYKWGGLILNPNGVLSARGQALRFGYDYILVEGDANNLLKIYEYNETGNILYHQIEYHD